MTEEQQENEEPEQQRDEKGKFSKKTKSKDHGQSNPKSSEYSKMNRILQKQLGLSAEKFLSMQDELEPQALFDKLSFVNENFSKTEPSTVPGQLPPNQPIAGQATGSTDRNDTIAIPGFRRMNPGKKGFSGSLDLLSLKTKKK